MPAKITICAEEGCRNVQTTKGYCRLHYLKNWKKIKRESRRKAAEKLNRYVEGICKKYPDRAAEEIRKDLQGGELNTSGGSIVPEDEIDGVLHDLGYDTEDTLDKILSNIKVDKGF